MDVAQAVAALLFEGRRPDLLEQLLDHRADPHDLGRLLDHVGERTIRTVVPLGERQGADRMAVGPDDDDLPSALAVRSRCSQGSILPRGRRDPATGGPVNRSPHRSVLVVSGPDRRSRR